MSFVTDNFRVQYEWNDTSGPGLTWTTITNSLTSFKMARPHQGAGSIQVVLYNNAIDPSQHPNTDDHIKKGQRSRAQVFVGGVWKNIFTGKIGHVDTIIGDKPGHPGARRLITYNAHDHLHDRKHKPHSHGVGKSDDLRAYIDQPFIINGLTTTKSSVGVNTFENDNTYEWDQILITRDTEQGFAWVDKDDVLNVTDRAHHNETVKAAITSADYSRVDLNYTIESVINQVVIKEIQKYKNGKTHVVHKNVFSDNPSIAKYGRFRATFTVQDHLATWASDAAFASNILTNNSDPLVVPVGCAIPITTTTDVSDFLDKMDLTDRVSINVDGTVYGVRVDTIKVETDGVLLGVAFTFINPAVVFKPHHKPGTGVANIPDSTLQNEHILDGEIQPPKTAYPVIGGTAGTSPTTPIVGELWIDSGNGNIFKKWNGTTWVSVQDGAIATAQATANGKNRVTYSTIDPGSTANTAGDLWFTYSGTIVSKQWQGNGGTSWTQVTVADTVIANLDAGKITSGFISAARISAKSITADKLLIGFGTNIIANPGFEEATTGPHTPQNSAVLTQTTAAGFFRSGVTAGNIAITGATGTLTNYLALNGALNDPKAGLQVSVGDTVHGEIWVRKSAGLTVGTARATLHALDSAGAVIATVTTGNSPVIPAIYTLYSVDYVVPAGVTSVTLNLYASGTSSTGTIQVDDMSLETKVTGALIVDGAIDGKTITGAILQTVNGVGPGVQGMQISSDLAGGVIKFYSGQASEAAGLINPGVSGTGESQIDIRTSSIAANLPARILMTSSGTFVLPTVRLVGTGIDVDGAGTVNGGLTVGGGYTLGGGGVINGGFTSNANVTINGASNTLSIPNAPTSASAANCRIGATGALNLVTSRTKDKVSPKKLTIERLKKVLDIPVVEFYDRQEWMDNKRSKEGLQQIPGVLAEDVENVDPLWADYHNGELVGVMYDRLGLSLIPLVRDLYERVEELEALV